MNSEKAKQCICAIISTWLICQEGNKYPMTHEIEIDPEDIEALHMGLKAIEVLESLENSLGNIIEKEAGNET